MKIDEIMSKQLYKYDTEDNPVYCTILHHAITAIATVAKGFPPYSGKSAPWESVFKNALEKTLNILKTVPNSQLVKDAVSFIFFFFFFFHFDIFFFNFSFLSFLISLLFSFFLFFLLRLSKSAFFLRELVPLKSRVPLTRINRVDH